MTPIIAGTFDSQSMALAAVNALLARGCSAGSVTACASTPDAAGSRVSARAESALPSLRRPPGIVIAVNADSGAPESIVIDVMRDNAARCIERAVGEWRNGHWLDFDPRSEPNLVMRRYQD